MEPDGSNSTTERLARAAEETAPDDSRPFAAQGEVQWKGQCETLGDVVDKKCHEDGEAKTRIGVVSREGYETFREFVESNGEGGLKGEREKGICRDVVVVVVAVRRGHAGGSVGTNVGGFIDCRMGCKMCRRVRWGRLREV